MEMFAGQANVWRAVSTKYPAARLDYEYDPQRWKAFRQSPMDILSNAGWTTHVSIVHRISSCWKRSRLINFLMSLKPLSGCR